METKEYLNGGHFGIRRIERILLTIIIIPEGTAVSGSLGSIK